MIVLLIFGVQLVFYNVYYSGEKLYLWAKMTNNNYFFIKTFTGILSFENTANIGIWNSKNYLNQVSQEIGLNSSIEKI